MSRSIEDLSPESVARWGQALYEALASRTPIAPITETQPDLTIGGAYRIQLDMIDRRMKGEGSHVVGRKIGATSRAVQEMLKVNQPDFGHLLSTMVKSDGATVSIDELIAPRAEGEIAFLLKRDLEGPGITAADVLFATEYVLPCFEIVDSRIRDWKIKIEDTVADNASSGMVILGGAVADPRKIDLALVGMTIEKNGEIAGIGAGAAALGHPLNAVAWLANTLGRLGMVLRAGEIILSGALSGLIPVAVGDSLRVSFGGIGTASVRFGRESGHGA